ncbi:outer membrane protein assembly factor BamB family protein [Halosimplex marinum]|uniref:outer membrane protein assembly factor BamB family protein n=1 Tax=Halosimplex marinum TaxID=3396620 RepID=UPI003F5460BD
MYQYGPTHRGVHPTARGSPTEFDRRWRLEPADLVPAFDGEENPPRISDPVVEDGTVYVTVSGLVRQYHIVAVDGETGSVRWAKQVLDNGNHSEFVAHPTVTDGVVYVPLPEISDGSITQTVRAFDAATGRQLWQAGDGPALNGRVVAADGDLYLGREPLVALRSDGSVNWELADGDRRESDVSISTARWNWPVTVTEQRVYVPTGSGVCCIGRDGTYQWSRDLVYRDEIFSDGAQPYTPTVGRNVYITTGGFGRLSNGRLLALDPSDGSTVWDFQPPLDSDRRAELVREDKAAFAGVYSTPALVDETLYVVGAHVPEGSDSATSYLYAVDAESGELRWTSDAFANFTQRPPVVANGTAYVAHGERISAFDAQTGTELTYWETDGVVRLLAITDSILYGSTRSYLYAFGEAPSG